MTLAMITGSSSWSPVIRYLGGFTSLYPAIEAWCTKVRLELPTGRRGVIASLSADGSIDGLAITKNGRFSKLCHISVAPHARDSGLGLSLMDAAVSHMLSTGACRVHVTTGEEVAADYGSFFLRCGFATSGVQRGRYRTGADEIEWNASAELLRSRLKRPGRADARTSAPPASRLVRLQWAPQHARFSWLPCP